MNRRSILKAAVVAPFVGLGTAKATIIVKAEPIKAGRGYIRFEDTLHKIIVDQGFSKYVESIRALLETFLGSSVSVLFVRGQQTIVHVSVSAGPQADMIHLMCLYHFKYALNGLMPRRQQAERAITRALNRMQSFLGACDQISKRLNME